MLTIKLIRLGAHIQLSILEQDPIFIKIKKANSSVLFTASNGITINTSVRTALGITEVYIKGTDDFPSNKTTTNIRSFINEATAKTMLANYIQGVSEFMEHIKNNPKTYGDIKNEKPFIEEEPVMAIVIRV